MARGTYNITPAVTALRGLIAYAESDKPAPALVEVIHAADRLASDAYRSFRSQTGAEREHVRLELRSFLRAMAAPPEAVMTAPIAPILQPLRTAGQVLLTVSGTPRDVTLYLAASLLQEVGTDRIRTCPAPDCGRAFVKIGRREHCSTRCQRRVWSRGYDPFAARARRPDNPQAKKRTRHGKATRSR